MPKDELVVELSRADRHYDCTAYEMLEEHIKEAVVLTGQIPKMWGPIRRRSEKLKIEGSSVTDTLTGKEYELAPELVEALSVVRRVTDLDRFVLRCKDEPASEPLDAAA